MLKKTLTSRERDSERIFILVVGVNILLFSILAGITNNLETRPIVVAVFLGLVFIGYFFILKLVLGSKLSEIKWNRSNFNNISGIVLGVIFLTSTIFAVAEKGEGFSVTMNIANCSIPLIVFTGLLVPINEEIAFRYLLLRLWIGKFKGSYLIPLVASALLFALLHFRDPQAMVSGFILGLIFGGIYLGTRNIMLVIVFHILHNLGRTLCLKVVVSEQIWNTLLICYCIAIIGGVIYALLLPRKILNKK